MTTKGISQATANIRELRTARAQGREERTKDNSKNTEAASSQSEDAVILRRSSNNQESRRTTSYDRPTRRENGRGRDRTTAPTKTAQATPATPASSTTTAATTVAATTGAATTGAATAVAAPAGDATTATTAKPKNERIQLQIARAAGFAVDDKENGRLRVDEVNKQENARAAAAKERQPVSAATELASASDFQTDIQKREQAQALEAIAQITPGITS